MKISMMRSNEGESNGCKEICSNVTERRILKRIKTIINKLLNCIFCKKSEGAMAPQPPVVECPVWTLSPRTSPTQKHPE